MFGNMVNIVTVIYNKFEQSHKWVDKFFKSSFSAFSFHYYKLYFFFEKVLNITFIKVHFSIFLYVSILWFITLNYNWTFEIIMLAQVQFH